MRHDLLRRKGLRLNLALEGLVLSLRLLYMTGLRLDLEGLVLVDMMRMGLGL